MAPNAEAPQQEVPKSPSPFHAGEQRVQTLTGAREVSETLGEHEEQYTSNSFYGRHVLGVKLGFPF